MGEGGGSSVGSQPSALPSPRYVHMGNGEPTFVPLEELPSVVPEVRIPSDY